MYRLMLYRRTECKTSKSMIRTSQLHFQHIENSNGYVFDQALPVVEFSVVDFQLTAGPEEQISIARMHFRLVVNLDESEPGTWINGVNLIPPAIQRRYFKQGKQPKSLVASKILHLGSPNGIYVYKSIL